MTENKCMDKVVLEIPFVLNPPCLLEGICISCPSDYIELSSKENTNKIFTKVREGVEFPLTKEEMKEKFLYLKTFYYKGAMKEEGYVEQIAQQLGLQYSKAFKICEMLEAFEASKEKISKR